MPTFDVELSSPASRSFHCQKAANSLDIDVTKKLRHHLSIDADVESPFSIGLIVGASGSGKTTLAQRIWGARCFRRLLKTTKPIIDQFPEEMDYKSRVAALNGVGLAQVVCWIRPAATLSNGQRERAEIALQLATPARKNQPTVIDEWTSVVDRTVAKVMSHCVAKHARRKGVSIVLLSCHYDVIEWLDPDWIIDCNKQRFDDRRCLQPGQEKRKRKERITFEVREVDRATWAFFSRYHYLTESFPAGHTRSFGLFCGQEQVGFSCFANYVPQRAGQKRKLHSNRVVIHPDYQGFGLGLKFVNVTSELLAREGFDIFAVFSSHAMRIVRERDPSWVLQSVRRPLKTQRGPKMVRHSGFRTKVTVYSYRYVPRAMRDAITQAAEKKAPAVPAQEEKEATSASL